MFKLLDLIPTSLLVAVIVGLSVWLGFEYVRASAVRIELAHSQTQTEQVKTELANYKESVAETTRILQASEDQKHEAQLAQQLKAENDAKAREAKLAADNASMQRSLDGLRRAVRIAASRNQMPQSPSDSGDQPLPIASQLLIECATAYGQLAAKADQLASDRQTLIDSWPK